MAQPVTLAAMKTSNAIQVAACAARIRSAAAEIQLMPAGRFQARDGRPFKSGHWVLDASAAQRVIALSSSRSTPFVIDYEHQTLEAPTSGQPAPAAGWFSQLEWREGEGLYAVDVEWTDRARSLIESDEYRYISPVFKFDHNTGLVRELLMAGVTNNPAIDGIADLAAARFMTTTEEDASVDKETLALLGLDEGASEEQIQAAVAALSDKAAKAADLEGELAVLRAQPPKDQKPDPTRYAPVSALTALQEELAALRGDLQTKEVDVLVQQGLDDGRLLKDMEGWARELGEKDVAALRSYLDKAQPIAALRGRQTEGREPGAGGSKLTDVELAVCRQLGMTEQDYLDTKEKGE
jgi:phage I-like protein